MCFKKKCQIFRVWGLYTIFLLHTTILKPFFFDRVPLFFTDYPGSFGFYQGFTGTIRVFSGTAGVAGYSCSAARIAFTAWVRYSSDNIFEFKI